MKHIYAADGRILTSPKELETLLKGAFLAFSQLLGHIRFFYVADEIWDGKSSLVFKTNGEPFMAVELDDGAFYINVAGENFPIADEGLLETAYEAIKKNATPNQCRPADQLTVNLSGPNAFHCGYRCDLCLGSKNSDPNKFSPSENFGYINFLCYHNCVPGVNIERFDGVWNCPGCAETRTTKVCRLSSCHKAMGKTDCAKCGDYHSCDIYRNCHYPGQCNLGLTAEKVTRLIIPYCARERLDFWQKERENHT
ncbi:MAG: hypothetical protein LBJ11_08275 [Oscillospiraceae bacterium]|nr:hypothetical protein [Oscillospiraceae bacterium]